MSMDMSLLPPAQPVSLVPRTRGRVRWALSRIRAYTGVQPPPAAPREQVFYGFAQPILGIRLLLADSELLKEALYPAGLLALACAVYAGFSAGFGGWPSLQGAVSHTTRAPRAARTSVASM